MGRTTPFCNLINPDLPQMQQLHPDSRLPASLAVAVPDFLKQRRAHDAAMPGRRGATGYSSYCKGFNI